MTIPQRPLVYSTSRYFLILLIMVVFALIISFVALSMGSTSISVSEVFNSFLSDAENLNIRIIKEIRLPRVMSGFCVGGLLALAGCLMQILLRNPLAEPYILGVSGGASAFALLAIFLGISGFGINVSAFIGAVLSIFLVFYLSRSGGNWNPLRTLLTGVVLAAGWGALVSFLLSVSPGAQVRGMLFWLMGDLSLGDFNSISIIVLIICLIVCLFISKALNLLAMGSLTAQSLGVSADTYTYIIYFISSLLTATAVMQAGSIGFIGLVVPHIARLLFGSDHRILLPVSVLLGGSLLVIADGLARTVLAPQQLPVGVLTALLGVPIFLILLQSVFKKES